MLILCLFFYFVVICFLLESNILNISVYSFDIACCFDDILTCKPLKPDFLFSIRFILNLISLRYLKKSINWSEIFDSREY